ncbi:hypothetical protein PV327_008836 [Microctonus hyperodae]|uniref:Uncharacterized protein n=1 Tax=Microctonus hyperodae TaxID=165561 RepID=A0AA39FSI9_MICHY|nr:hypothetical protein PV327_008836 [Microctonus hyperodae]
MGSGVGEVATIFQPRRSRAPSIILNDDQSTHSPYASPGQVVLDTSNGCEQQGCNASGGCGDSASSCRSLETGGSCAGSGGGGSGPGGGGCPGGQGHNQQSCHMGVSTVNYQTRRHSLSRCYHSCCAESAKKLQGILLSY